MQRNSKPLSWRARGLSDALDASDSFNGSMSSLQNLIPDPSTKSLWQCRPAAKLLIQFKAAGGQGPFSSGFSSGFQFGAFAGFISCMKRVGNFVYGMVPNGLVSGFDAPFCFNLLTNTQIAVTGVQNNQTLPASPPSTGAWTPPRMDVIGVKLMVCHPGFTGASGNYVGWFDITNPAAPVWNAGNMGGTIAFTVAPTDVVQFFNRAYYIHNAPGAPAVIFSDALNATNATNPNQVLTFGDSVALTALGALPLSNQLGGVIQSVIVFKDYSNLYQITGDAATTPASLAVNSLNVATGTAAPNSICATPKGLAFISQDGLRIMDFNANVSDPIGLDGSGVTVPFTQSAVPSRICAACNASLLRITTQNGSLGSKPQQEYWYDFGRQIWSGPHTFAASLIESYNQTFIVAPIAVIGSLWQSDVIQSSTSSFVENGNQLMWQWQTSLLPDTDQMTNNCMTEGTLDLSLPPNSSPVVVNALDQNSSSISGVAIQPQTSGATIWGAFTWGGAKWSGGLAAALAPYELQWTLPVVFSRMSIVASGQSAANFKVGALHTRYQILRQLTNTQAAA